MAKTKSRTLTYCNYCKNGIGIETYKSTIIDGEYCTSDCYMDAVIEDLGFGLKGRFKLKTDGHGGVILVS
jgi:hypothetical protein